MINISLLLVLSMADRPIPLMKLVSICKKCCNMSATGKESIGFPGPKNGNLLEKI